MVKLNRFDRLVLSQANLADLPPTARRSADIRLIPVPTVEAAVIDVLGPVLGLAARNIEQAFRAPQPSASASAESEDLPSRSVDDSGTPGAAALAVRGAGPARGSGEGGADIGPEPVKIDVCIRPADASGPVRDPNVPPEEDVHSWCIGDRFRIHAGVDRRCYLSLISIGSSGDATVLIPNTSRRDALVGAGAEIVFPGPPDRFDGPEELIWEGPPGRERIIALATRQPPPLLPEDFDQSPDIGFARPTVRELERVMGQIALTLVGRGVVECYVSGPDATGVAGRGAGTKSPAVHGAAPVLVRDPATYDVREGFPALEALALD